MEWNGLKMNENKISYHIISYRKGDGDGDGDGDLVVRRYRPGKLMTGRRLVYITGCHRSFEKRRHIIFLS